jgi:hypothetical protein
MKNNQPENINRMRSFIFEGVEWDIVAVVVVVVDFNYRLM